MEARQSPITLNLPTDEFRMNIWRPVALRTGFLSAIKQFQPPNTIYFVIFASSPSFIIAKKPLRFVTACPIDLSVITVNMLVSAILAFVMHHVALENISSEVGNTCY